MLGESKWGCTHMGTAGYFLNTTRGRVNQSGRNSAVYSTLESGAVSTGGLAKLLETRGEKNSERTLFLRLVLLKRKTLLRVFAL